MNLILSRRNNEYSLSYVSAVATIHAVHARRSGWSLNAGDTVDTWETGHTHFTSVTFQSSRSLWSGFSFVALWSFQALHSLETWQASRTRVTGYSWRSLHVHKTNVSETKTFIWVIKSKNKNILAQREGPQSRKTSNSRRIYLSIYCKYFI